MTGAADDHAALLAPGVALPGGTASDSVNVSALRTAGGAKEDEAGPMRWTLRALLDAAGIRADVGGDAEIRGLAHDSREVAAGDLFCCIPGARADGHDHAPAAIAAGASALLVERDVDVDAPLARVERVRDALGPLSAAFFGRPSEAMRVAGVTGTNGKTTVTYLVEAMATAAGRTAGIAGTVETRVGDVSEPAVRTTPEAVDLQRTLARMRDAGAEVVALEVTSHGLDQGRVAGTRFACVGFTNLSRDHLDYHHTLEEYFEAKARLFDPSYAPRAVVNAADPYGRRLTDRISGLEVLTYGSSGADIVCDRAETRPDATAVRIATPEGPVEARIGLVGRHNVDNLLCATGLALGLGLAPEAIAAGAEALRSVPGRLERVEAGQAFGVLVDYAHTPDALARALEASRELSRGRLIVVFGCGGDRDREKRPLMGEAATRLADLSVFTSDNPRSEDPLKILSEVVAGAGRGGGAYRVVPDRREAIAAALAEAREGDVVLVAGKGHETGQTFADRTVPFDDREVVREELEALGCRS